MPKTTIKKRRGKKTSRHAPGWLSTKDFAARLGCSASLVRNSLKSGRVSADNWRKVDGVFSVHAEPAERDWWLNVNPDEIKNGKSGYDADHVRKMQRKYLGELAASEPETLPDGETIDISARKDALAGLPITKLRQAKEAAAVLKAEIELEELRGRLLSREVVYSELYNFGQEIRRKFDQVPARCVDEVLSAPSRTEAVNVIRSAIDEVLLELTNTPSL